MCASGGQLLQKPSSDPLPVLQFVRHCRSRYRGWRPKTEVSSEIWQLLNEYDVPATIKRVYNVRIEAAETPSKQVQLSLHGRDSTDPPRKLDVHERFDSWLLAEGPDGLRVKDIRIRSGALVRLSRNKRSVLLVGPSEATLEAKRMIDRCDCVEEFDVDNFVGFYLINNKASHLKRLSIETDALVSPVPVAGAAVWRAVVVGPKESVKRLRSILDGLHVERRQIPQVKSIWLKIPGKGAERARLEDLERKSDTSIQPGSYNDNGDPAQLVDLIVVGERREKVDEVLAVIEGIHVKRCRIQRAVRSWLASTSKGAERARSVELNRKFDTLIHSGPVSDKDDPDCMVDLAVVGEREVILDEVLSIIDGLHVKRLQIPQIKALWLKIPGKGADCSHLADLERKFDIRIEPGPRCDDSDPAQLVDLTVVGEREENVDDVLAKIDGIPVKRRRIQRAVRSWLASTSKGAERARSVELNRKFDTLIHSGPLNDKDDHDYMVDLTVVGKREETVNAILAIIDGLHVKHRQIPQITALWLKIPGKRAKCARLADLERKFDTCIDIEPGPSNDDSDPARLVELTVVGELEENVDDVLAIIDGLQVKRRQIPQVKSIWLKIPGKGAERARIVDLERKFDTCTLLGPLIDDIDPARLVEVAVVGRREENVDDVLAVIDGIHVNVKRRRIPRAVRSWLASTSKGAERARSIELSRKFDTLIHSGPLNDNDDPDCMFDLVVLGEREENMDDVLAIIDRLHVAHGQLPRAVCWWLINTKDGSKHDRRADLEGEFDTRVYIRPLNDDVDPTRMEKFAVVGERKESVDEILAAIGSIVVEKVNVAKDQEVFWTGPEHDHNRPLRELERTTDTHIAWDKGESCLHVSGRPEGIKEAVELTREHLDTPPPSGSG